jgi:hypothetical protein
MDMYLGWRFPISSHSQHGVKYDNLGKRGASDGTIDLDKQFDEIPFKIGVVENF